MESGYLVSSRRPPDQLQFFGRYNIDDRRRISKHRGNTFLSKQDSGASSSERTDEFHSNAACQRRSGRDDVASIGWPGGADI